jgi:hypothetical protein
MLDLSAKNVVVAVRLYAPTAAAPLSPSSAPPSPTPLSATSPTPADSSSPVPPPMVVTTVEKDREIGESEGEKEVEVALPPPSVISADSRPLLSGHEGNAGMEGITIDTDSIKQKSSADKEDSPTRKGDEAPSPKGPVLRTPVLPVQRIILSTEDLVLSFGRAGRRRRRVLGR